jgi:hypothetical protein
MKEPFVTIGGHDCSGFVDGKLGPTILPAVLITVRRGSEAERKLFEQFKADVWEPMSFTLDGVKHESLAKVTACEHVMEGSQFTFTRRSA